MRLIDDTLYYSPSDLVVYFRSPFASWMDRAHFEDRSRSEMMDADDPLSSLLADKGSAHEAKFNLALEEGGRRLVEIPEGDPQSMFLATVAAMKSGADVIVQGSIYADGFGGIADLLVRVEGASALGSWHYEVWDTKLSKTMKPHFAIQLCAYAELLHHIQGRHPDNISIVLGNAQKVDLKTADYIAFFRRLRRSFLEMQATFDPAQMPDPGDSATHGKWSKYATRLFEERDDLQLVANITRGQIKSLRSVGINTVTALATTSLEHVAKMNDAILARLRRQAAMQVSSRGKDRPEWEAITAVAGQPVGLALLPPASSSDIFFDLEGFPLVEGGLEYLWGITYYDDNGGRAFRDFWAHDREQEKIAFCDFVHWAYDRWLRDPTMHIYHYASYEVSAVRRLMGRHAACEFEVDQLLRNNVFVDLYQVVRHSMIVGEPRYSIKNIEHLYRERRQTEVASGGDSVVVYENWRQNPDGADWQTSKVLADIRSYNKDDCDSTEELTLWLRERQRQQGIAYGLHSAIKEPPRKEEKAEIAALREHLLAEAARTMSMDAETAEAIETLAYSLEFHERESKPGWWRFFDRQESSEVELFEDADCLAGLIRTSTRPVPVGGRSSKWIYEYRFDANQDFKSGAQQYRVIGPEEIAVTIDDIDEEEGVVRLCAGVDLPPKLSLLPFEFIPSKPIPDAIAAAAEFAASSNYAPSALLDFLRRARPRIRGNAEGPVIKTDDSLAGVIEAVRMMDSSCLCVQGPPGAGKTYTASHVILALLKEGRSVGVSSNSHKAINNLMSAVLDEARRDGCRPTIVKVDNNKDRDPEFYQNDEVVVFDTANNALKSLPRGPILVGGTAWLFSNPGLRGRFDYLFVDEAGQVAVANLIGMSGSTANVVLLGDQMQLSQPTQGAHPGSSGLSLLQYYMQDYATIPEDRGVFLSTTHRMHPKVCEFISEAIYEKRLTNEPLTEKRYLVPRGPLVNKSAGIMFRPVEHEGNTQASDEEIDEIKSLWDELSRTKCVDGVNPEPRDLTLDDVLFITPYNHQRRKLQEALGRDAKVGTVDKFQGQQALVVIVSLCSSNVGESPRGLDFLLSKNRLNVAISRAKCLAIVVATPGLVATSVMNLPQMELASLFCRIVEVGSGR